MALTRRSRYKNQSNRRGLTGPGTRNQIVRRPPITITDATPGDSTVVTFDQPVVLAGIPQWPNNSSHVPEAAELTGPQELTLTYPVADTTTSFTVPFEDPAVRNNGGGYVLPGTFPAG